MIIYGYIWYISPNLLPTSSILLSKFSAAQSVAHLQGLDLVRGIANGPCLVGQGQLAELGELRELHLLLLHLLRSCGKNKWGYYTRWCPSVISWFITPY
jgi:hypothetical protein